jgi:peptidoglycan/xylan/chitin deacetylase (PgdA/CDA1 family)
VEYGHTVLFYHSIRREDLDSFQTQVGQLLELAQPLLLDFPGSAADLPKVTVTFDDAYENVVVNALPVLKYHHVPCIIFVPTGCLGQLPLWITDDNNINREEKLISEDVIRAFDQALVGVGSHSVSHPHFAWIDDESVRSELVNSKIHLERLCNCRIELLSLPYGSYTQETLQIARRAGYRKVFLNVPVTPGDSEGGFLVGRVAVSPSDWLIEFRLKVLGAYSWLAPAIAIKRRLRALTPHTEKDSGWPC